MNPFLQRNRNALCLLLICLLCFSCATYYRQNNDLMKAVYGYNFDNAEKILNQPHWEKSRSNLLLHYMNKGTVLWMNNKHAESNQWFQKADFYIEDYKKNYGASIAALLTNSKSVPYQGEGFEQVLLHYYTTLNYMHLGQLDEALVECKRMHQKLTRITDYYSGNNKYKKDAFAHNLMGMIYDAQHNYNDAFIAYRNAYEIYNADYIRMLNTAVPMQLRKDIIRTAWLTGFREEAKAYEKEFNLSYNPEDEKNGSLLFFWHNGLGPVKDQWSINFTVLPDKDGWVKLVNWELNMTFPFYVGEDEKGKKDSRDITQLKFVRVAFPKYISRNLFYKSATLSADSNRNVVRFDVGEDVNAIAYRSLEDRMLKELGDALIRVALKQVAEMQLRKQNEGLGTALSVINALTEQADTRNWQMLPYQINYTRISLPEGENKVSLTTTDVSGVERTTALTYHIKKGQTSLGCFQSLQFSGYSNRNNPFFQ